MADRLTLAAFADLKGFGTEDFLAPLQHMREVLLFQLTRSPALGPAKLSDMQVQAWTKIAQLANAVTTPEDARHFFLRHFDVWQVVDEPRPQGLFTGYFEPELKGSRRQSAAYPFPVYIKPRDLVAFSGEDTIRAGVDYGKWQGGEPVAYDSREEIDKGSLNGRAEIICYVANKTELFFMHVQGSGRIALDTGETLRLGYAAKSGRSYQSIGAVLVRENLLPRDAVSMQSIKLWITEHPDRRDWLLWHNPSYVFFAEMNLPDATRGSLGAAGIQLVPKRSLAIDKTRYAYGTPVWLSTTLPDQTPFNRLMIAADTGSAILGAARGDIYFGWGREAEDRAGHMKQPGQMFVLLPKR